METPKNQGQDVISEKVDGITEGVAGGAQEVWVKPAIVAFDPVTITRSNTSTPGDALSSLIS